MRTLFCGGPVYTPADPNAQAMLVEDGTLAWVGSRQAASAMASGADQVVDLRGALVTPAFVDAHAHVTETGLALTGLDLTGAHSLGEVLEAVERAGREGRGGPVLGHGWDERQLAEGRPPTMAELDRASAGAVVYLSRVDVHSAVVSSALAAAAGARGLPGFDDDGRVEREAHHAVRDATRRANSPAHVRTLQETALRAAAAAGIAAVHEMSAPHIGSRDDLLALLALVELSGGTLPQVIAYLGELVADADAAGEVAAAFGGRLVGLGGDLNVDGSVGSRTAAYREPYADAPGHRGHAYLTAEQVRDHVLACCSAWLQAGFHVIGDAGVDTVLAGFALAAQVNPVGVRGGGHRLEHVESIDADGVAEMARLGLTASVQPAFDALWGGEEGLYAERLGLGRALALNPFASLAAAGVPLALGSDSPVTPFAPWEAVRACAFHHVREQRLSASAAFAAHTTGAWRAAVRPETGVLRPGSPATFAVWEPGDLAVRGCDDQIQAGSSGPRSVTPALPDLTPGAAAPRCLRTVLRGRTLYEAP